MSMFSKNKSTGNGMSRRQLRRLAERGKLTEANLRKAALKVGVSADKMESVIDKAKKTVTNISGSSSEKMPSSMTFTDSDVKTILESSKK